MPVLIRSPYAWQKPPAGSQLDWSHPLASGLVAAYFLLEGNGIVSVDLADGTNSSAWGGATPLAWSAGSLRFVNSVIDFPSTPKFAKLTTNMSVQIWARQSSQGAFNRMFSKWSGSAGWILSYENTWRFWANFTGSGTVNVSAAVNTGLEAWHHIVGTYDGLIQKLYVDGILRTSTARTGTITTNASVVRFGLDESNGSPFVGLLDAGACWNRTLSENDVRQLYAEPFAMLRGPDVFRRYYGAFAVSAVGTVPFRTLMGVGI